MDTASTTAVDKFAKARQDLNGKITLAESLLKTKMTEVATGLGSMRSDVKTKLTENKVDVKDVVPSLQDADWEHKKVSDLVQAKQQWEDKRSGWDAEMTPLKVNLEQAKSALSLAMKAAEVRVKEKTRDASKADREMAASMNQAKINLTTWET